VGAVGPRWCAAAWPSLVPRGLLRYRDIVGRRIRIGQGFTLIEAMVVVLVTGILAALAIVAYQKWTRTARLGEARDLVGHIRTAEESYRAETGNYLNVSKALTPPQMYPAPTPGAFKTAWGAACAVCVNPDAWSWLTVAPANPVWYGYAVMAGTSSTPPSMTVTVNGAAVDLSSMTGQPWYVVSAMGDTNGDGIFTTVYGFSNTNQIMVDREGE
jgi:prepilin-type N-terminal cleavage/methylation domain-containing protein